MSAFTRGALWLAWQGVRLPIVAFLLIIEPIVWLVFSIAALLGVITAFLFEFSAAAPTFPFWGMVAFSVGCMFALMVYYALVEILSR